MNTSRNSKSYRVFKRFIRKNYTLVTKALDIFFKGLKEEAKDTKKTRLIIQSYVSKGKISKEDEQFLKFYMVDLLKIAGIGIPFVLLPGASIIIPFIIKAAEKRNIDLLPSNFQGEDD